ncbi:hypothetical protein MtrunA17_Chr2g0327111 [Medicago truncatula]|uniref:Uncharacterized protein n=1 Tax=Medicago truncatula TaxID=3880 RepID=A0A396JFS3_MEDTR|nr:hypothetical protein MtrunA17_Chr2g0327111 [Medicago truncatula]
MLTWWLRQMVERSSCSCWVWSLRRNLRWKMMTSELRDDDDDGVVGVWVVRLERGVVDFGVEALMAILVLHIGK